MSLPSSFNPSDYQFLIRSLSQGNTIAKSQALKRLQILATSDKKQFVIYAKRLVLCLQDLLSQPKLSVLASLLVIELINLNPKDIQYYVRTKLLKRIVLNLGDSKPQLRKSSHYCILAYIKVFKMLDEVLSLYSQFGLGSNQVQLRQKSINSYQSIIINDPKSINWDSHQFKKIFQNLLERLRDQNPYVQKAAQQCLLALSRFEQINDFVKKLGYNYASLYKLFCQTQRSQGNLAKIKSQKQRQTPPLVQVNKDKINQSANNLQKTSQIKRQDSINKQMLIQKIQEIRRNSQTPKIVQGQPKVNEKKQKQVTKSFLLPSVSQKQLVNSNQQITKPPPNMRSKSQVQLKPISLIAPLILAQKSEVERIQKIQKIQRIQNIFDKKMMQDLKNDKDWKIRLQSLEQLQNKYQIYKSIFDSNSISKTLVPSLIKLTGDQNFKVASVSLKILQDMLKLPKIQIDLIVPPLVDKISDTKANLRQGITRLIRTQYERTQNNMWIDCTLDVLKKSTNMGLKQQLLGLLTRMYEDLNPKYSLQKIVDTICPLMDDPKTKIKIKTLDLLVELATSTRKIDQIKSILSPKLNQVYYQMFLQKVNKQLKARITPRLVQSQPPAKGQSRTISFPSLRKNKNSANNTTSSSLQKYNKTIQVKSISRDSSYTDLKTQSLIKEPKNFIDDFSSVQNTPRQTPVQTVRKKPNKVFKKRLQKTLQAKLATSSTAEPQHLRPFADPQRQSKNILPQLKSQDWQTAFDALTRLRRIIKHHNQVLGNGLARSIVNQVARLVESLRSSLSKNAVITLGECAQTLGNTLDPQLQGIFGRLMRKTLDTNSFISQQVKKALLVLCINCNQSKVVNILTNYHTSRALPIKLNIIYALQIIAFMPKFEKQIQKIVPMLINFSNQGAIQIRQKNKQILCKLLQRQNSGPILKLLPQQLKSKIGILQNKKRKIESIIKSQVSSSSSNIIKQKQFVKQTIPNQQTPIKKKKILVFPKQFQQLQNILKNCEVTQWKNRQTALSNLSKIIKQYPQQISQHRYGPKTIQTLAKQSNDSNLKVSISALNLFIQLVPNVSKLIQTNLAIVTSQILNCFGSNKAQVRQLSMQLFDWMLVQHLCTGALYGNAKSRGPILVKLLKILPHSFKNKKNVVGKHIYSLLNKLILQNRGDLAPILKQIVIKTLALGGQQAYSSLKQQVKNIVEE